VPHSQCSLRENPKFLQNFGPKNNTLKRKTITFLHKRKFPKLTSTTQVSFVNEAPGLWKNKRVLVEACYRWAQTFKTSNM
jgi:hypothetical protein